MNNDATQINVIKSDSGGMHLPRLPKPTPLVIILVTIVLALVTAASVFLLYQNRQTPIAPTAPTPSRASTTQTISDNFDAATLDTSMWSLSGTQAGSGVSQTEGQLNIPITGSSALTTNAISSVNQIAGDFSLSVDLKELTATTIPAIGSITNGLGYFEGVSSVTLLWVKDAAGKSFVQMFNGSTALSTKDVAAGILPKLKLTRIGNTIQGNTDLGSGFQLVDTILDSTLAGNGNIVLLAQTTNLDTANSASTKFDNLTAQINLAAVQPTPVPGTTAACALTFTVLDTVITGTPAPTATPTPTPTPGPSATPTATGTPGPTATPTPQPTPASCNNTCTTNANCTNDLICTGGQCRNPQCTSSTSCTCVVATPTPTSLVSTSTSTTVVALGPTPTPVILQTAGSITGTWILGIGGALILGLGAILLFAL